MKSRGMKTAALTLALAGGGTARAAGADMSGAVDMTAAYALCAVLSAALLCLYGMRKKKRTPWMTMLLAAVFVVNLGYTLLALSDTLAAALWANRVAYLGSVFLPLCMLMALSSVCQMALPRRFTAAMACVSGAVFLLAASPGVSTLYYKEVELVSVGGMTRLEKVYGPLHDVYLLYVLALVGLMIAMLVGALLRRRTVPVKYAGVLVVIVLLNVVIWFVERLIYAEFEFLSVSYIVSALLIWMLHELMEEFGSLARAAEAAEAAQALAAVAPAPAEETRESAAGFNEEQAQRLMAAWPAVEELTGREREVLYLLLMNRRRRDIACELSVTEHTVKKHTANIFAKTGVTSRGELFEKAAQESAAGITEE